jgi:RadC-like JAB domain
VHNYPSGDPTPSQTDIHMTRAIVDIATPLGISVHDHINVGRNEHASLKGDEADLEVAGSATAIYRSPSSSKFELGECFRYGHPIRAAASGELGNMSQAMEQRAICTKGSVPIARLGQNDTDPDDIRAGATHKLERTLQARPGRHDIVHDDDPLSREQRDGLPCRATGVAPLLR